MPPVRRHLRISPYTVLEVRVYLDPPANPGSWLLRESDPALNRIIEDIRGLVLQRVKEERVLAHTKAKKTKEVKDSVTGSDYTASVFFTPLASNYTLLVKSLRLDDRAGQHTSNDGDPIVLDEDDEEGPSLSDIPERPTVQDLTGDDDATETAATDQRPRGGDDKKKIAGITTYEGLNLFDKTLVLIVKRHQAGPSTGDKAAKVMENWLASTQMADDMDTYD